MSKRFIRRGVSKILFSPTPPANRTAVARAELDSATDLTDEIADMSGWMLSNNAVAVPDLGSTFEKNIPGTDQAADSSITFYEDADEDTIDALLPKGTEGVVYLMRKGDKPTSKSLDVFDVRVASKGSEWSVGNEPARTVVQFSITEEPALDTEIPAASGG